MNPIVWLIGAMFLVWVALAVRIWPMLRDDIPFGPRLTDAIVLALAVAVAGYVFTVPQYLDISYLEASRIVATIARWMLLWTGIYALWVTFHPDYPHRLRRVEKRSDDA